MFSCALTHIFFNIQLESRERRLVMFPPLLLSLLRRADQVIGLVLTVPPMSSCQTLNHVVDVRFRTESLLLLVMYSCCYDVGKLLDLHVDLKQLSLKYNLSTENGVK